MSDFHGEPTYILENQYVKLEYLANSARIVRFSYKGKDNLFADLGLSPVKTPYGDFYFRGGHRLWHSPEMMPRTYLPDNEGATVSKTPNGVRIEMPPEPWTHIVKAIEIQLHQESPRLIIRHELQNNGAWNADFAPWAITMFRLGGVAIFPQPQGNVDNVGLLPNRRLSFWPYTSVEDPRLVLRDDFFLVCANPALPPAKLGYFNPYGWMAYWFEGVLFVKRFESLPSMQYPDNGCNSECFCNDQFIELESLGPIESVSPGKSVIHTEIWEVYDTLDVPFISNEVKALVGISC